MSSANGEPGPIDIGNWRVRKSKVTINDFYLYIESEKAWPQSPENPEQCNENKCL